MSVSIGKSIGIVPPFALRSAVAIASLSAVSACGGTQDVTVRVDPSESHQTIEAWEVVPRLWEFDKDANAFNNDWLKDRDAILEKLIGDFGVTGMRVEIRSGAENPIDYWPAFAAHKMSYEGYKSRFYEKINDDSDPAHINPGGFQFSELDFRVEEMVLPAMQIARRHGRELALNLNYVDFKWTDNQGSLSHADQPDEYAELIVATYDHLQQKYALVPDTLEIILEPDNTKGWRGRQIGSAMRAVAERFEAAGKPVPPMIAPSTANAGRSLKYLDGIVQVPGAADLLQTISYHRYDALLPADTIRAIGDRGRRMHKRTAMLEHVEGDAAELLQDLTEADASSWLQWGIAWNGTKDGYPIIVDDGRSGEGRLRFSPIGQQLALIFTQVRPGAVRIGAKGDDPALRSAAFRDRDGRLVLVMAAAPPGGSGIWAKLMKRLNPRRSYRVQVAGFGSDQLAVKRVDAAGRQYACTASAGVALPIATGGVLTVMQGVRGWRAPPCR